MDGNFISLDEAYYICGIMNTKLVYDYMMSSSDSRSFPIRPRIKIPKYDAENKIHVELSKFCKEAHEFFDDIEKVKLLCKKMEEGYRMILEQ